MVGVDALLAAIGKPLPDVLQVWNAREPDACRLDPRAAQIVRGLDSPQAASDAKLRLLKLFRDEHPVLVVSGAGGPEPSVQQVPLSELDRSECGLDACAFLEGLPLERASGFYGLVNVVDRLLGPGGCPWDREQTHQTLKTHMLEETYETLEAIDSGDPGRLCEELGDFLLQALMHAQMDAARSLYGIDDVIAGITDKLLRRHPHVFGDASAATADEVLKNWDAIKQTEKDEKASSILDGVPKSMPALLRAHEVSKRAARVGFEWPSLEGVFEKMGEEQRELREAISSGDSGRVEEELGDLLFALVNVARWLKVEPEDALRGMVNRFVARFEEMERTAPKPLRELSMEEWDVLWKESKSAPTQ